MRDKSVPVSFAAIEVSTAMIAGGAEHSGLGQFLEILLQPDNIPIAGMMVLVLFFTYLGFREARKNDELIARGRQDEILKKMQE